MTLFVSGGMYQDYESGTTFFSLLLDDQEIPCGCVDKPFELFPLVFSIAHVYRVSDDLLQLDLEIASEAAEALGIRALRRVDLNQYQQQDICNFIDSISDTPPGYGRSLN